MSASRLIKLDGESDFGKTMLEEILALSPVESLQQWRTVSKYWNDLICSPEFTLMQLRHSRKKLKYLICPYTGFLDGVTDACFMESDGEITNKITLPYLGKSLSVRMLGSSNGLLCFVIEKPKVNDMDIIICNPITKKLLTLPKGSPSVDMPSVGIAYHPENGQYKVFRFFEYKAVPAGEDYACEVYSSVSGSWRGMGDAQYRPMFSPHCLECACHICIDGSAFWFCRFDKESSIPSCILSVDIKEENLKTINFPEGIQASGYSFLVDLDGRLSLITLDCEDVYTNSGWDCMKNSFINVWVLEDLHLSSWSHKAFAELQVNRILYFNSVVAIKNEIFFIITDVDMVSHYHVYNLDEAIWRTIDMGDTRVGFSPVATLFAESLLPCRGINEF